MRRFVHHSYFPLTLTLLTLGLVVFMFYAFTYEETPTTGYQIMVEEPEPVDVGQYQSDLVYMLDTFEDVYASESDGLVKLVAAEEAVDTTLGMRVPTEFKELHLELAVAFNQLQTALRNGDVQGEENILNTIEELKVEYSWLGK